jgi:cytoplasmic iron level regulating protein YaaA (DUF328/UPF0246 family)
LALKTAEFEEKARIENELRKELEKERNELLDQLRKEEEARSNDLVKWKKEKREAEAKWQSLLETKEKVGYDPGGLHALTGLVIES